MSPMSTPKQSIILSPACSVEVGKGIRERRLKLRMTRAELAIRAQCSMTFLENVESGLVPQRSEVLPRLLGAVEQAEASAAATTDSAAA